ncbi:etoposide-induced protein 2.4-domain-containing protein [Auriculariales sp. MPI-PUGE-AT-0066]|nr:etoposide-induced protein 2.4-domain-containing protein [Auriculariales sp. MPI-PUGE-AT-0066]
MSRATTPQPPLHSIPYGSSSHVFPAYNTAASYPSFVPLGRAVTLHVGYAVAGLMDALRWDLVTRHIIQDSEIRANVVKSVTLNGLSVVSAYAWEFVIVPLLRGPTQRRISMAFQGLWLVPLASISLLLNARWCSAIAARVFMLQYGRSNMSADAGGYSGVLNAAAASAYRFALLFTSVVSGLLLTRVPYFGWPAAVIFLCWVDSFYICESVWIARGMSLAARVKYLEERWVYFLAFGLPVTLSCAFLPALPSTAVFAFFLPFHIIMAHHARPLPLHPYTPLPPQGSKGTLLLPSPFIPVRVPVFAPAIWMNDWIVRLIGAGAGVRRAPVRRPQDPFGMNEADRASTPLAPRMGPTLRTHTARTAA